MAYVCIVHTMSVSGGEIIKIENIFVYVFMSLSHVQNCKLFEDKKLNKYQ